MGSSVVGTATVTDRRHEHNGDQALALSQTHNNRGQRTGREGLHTR